MPALTSSLEQPFPVRRIGDVEPQLPERLWLVDDLWLREGVGVLGGPPKVYKTWLAAELALGVATGSPVLGHYRVREPGPVLFFGAEDSLPSLRTRFEGMARALGRDLDNAPLYLLDLPALRLDTPEHLRRLEATVRLHQTRLLVLDPLVRIAAIDENVAAEVSTVLGGLRLLQRRSQVAVLLVHHTRKAAGSSPTLAFRGSGDFGAWSDSNLILNRRKDALSLTIEHRSAPAPEPLMLCFRSNPAPHLALLAGRQRTPEQVADQLEAALFAFLPKNGVPLPTSDLRKRVGRRKADVIHALKRLEQAGRVERTKDGWRRIPTPHTDEHMRLFPVPPLRDGNAGTIDPNTDPSPLPSGLPPDGRPVEP